MTQKRFLVVHMARTTGSWLMHTWTDAPAEALNLAKELSKQGARDVHIRDMNDDNLYALDAFEIVHKLN